MILPFKTEINNRQTYFVEKILKGLRDTEGFAEFEGKALGTDYKGKYPFNRYSYSVMKPKLHTIRLDEKKRWHAGRLIHTVINNRTKKQLQFSPVLICISTQHIIITCNPKLWSVIIDGQIYACINPQTKYEPSHPAFLKLLLLANNDGFETVEAFFTYFNKGFSGKIIHWTYLKY